MRLIFTFILFVLLGCQTKTSYEENETDAVIKDYDSLENKNTVAKLDSFKSNQDKKSKSQKSKLPVTLLTLKDFEQNGDNRSSQVNDSLFAEFLKSFTTYQDNMNTLLFDNPKYDTYNTLIYADKNQIDTEAKEFEDSIQNIGFYVSISEGIIFLEKDPEFLKKFSPYLSERMNTFRIQYSKEIQNPIAEDGGIIISTSELIQRMLFWEKFADNNDFQLPNYANDQFKMHLFYLMFGMDNTPIHNWSDSLNIRPELIKTYKDIIDKHPNSKSAIHLSDYLSYLEKKNYQYDNSFHEYGREMFPDMYNN